METIIKKFKSLSNQELINRANRAADFCWDDEGWELERRKEASNGKFNYKMEGNKIVIVAPANLPELIYDYITAVTQKQGRLMQLNDLFGDGSRWFNDKYTFTVVYNQIAQYLGVQTALTL